MPSEFDPYHVWLGIPPEDQPPDHYRLLGIRQGEPNPDVIEHAADRQMAHLRSFQTGKHAELSQQLLNEVAAARTCLLSARKRAAYDAWLVEQASAGGTAAAAETGSPPRASRSASVSQLATVLVGLVALAVLGMAAWRMITTSSEPSSDWAVESSEEEGDLPPHRPPPPSQLAASAGPADPTSTAENRQTIYIDVEEGEDPNQRYRRPTTITAGRSPDLLPPAGRTTETGRTADVAEHPVHAGVSEPVGTPESNARSSMAAPADVESRAVRSSVAEPPIVKLKQPVPVEKSPVPPPSLQVGIVAQLDELYHFDQLTTPTQKTRIAGELCELAGQIRDEPAERFVTLRKAMEFACEAANVTLMLQAIDRIGDDFEIDVLQVKVTMLEKVGPQITEAAPISVFVRAAQELIDEALGEEQYETALRLANMARHLGQSPEGARFAEETSARYQELQQLGQQYQKVQRALATLQADPDYAPAHLVLGRWYCFTKRDWDAENLEHLAKGSNPELAAVARQELDVTPTTAAERIELADKWWELAQQNDGEDQIALVQRAQFWYEQARRRTTTSLLRRKIARRLEEIAELSVAIEPSPGGDATTASDDEPLDVLIAEAWQRATRGGSDDARETLAKLDRQNPDYIRTDFTLGLICAICDHEWPSAAKYFSKCTKRQPEHVPSWNNLALVNLRLAEHHDALRNWRTALQLSGTAPEILANLRRLRYLNEREKINLSESAVDSLTELCASVIPADEPSHGTPSAWQYMPFDSESASAGSRAGDRPNPFGSSTNSSAYEDRWCVVCNGRGAVKCPNNMCARGTVRGHRPETAAVNPVSGERIIRMKTIRVTCRTCSGRGTVPCRNCTDGKN